MVVVVLFLFLLNFRTTFITLMAMPMSFAITLLTFRAFDITVNSMTLGGLAVAIGMVLAFELSEALSLCQPGAATRLKAHFDGVGLPTTPKGRGFDTDTLLAHMYQDKKVVKGQVTFILAHEIGKAVIAHDVDMAHVARVLEHSLKG